MSARESRQDPEPPHRILPIIYTYHASIYVLKSSRLPAPVGACMRHRKFRTPAEGLTGAGAERRNGPLLCADAASRSDERHHIVTVIE